jgi:hypothetical protein
MCRLALLCAALLCWTTRADQPSAQEAGPASGTLIAGEEQLAEKPEHSRAVRAARAALAVGDPSSYRDADADEAASGVRTLCQHLLCLESPAPPPTAYEAIAEPPVPSVAAGGAAEATRESGTQRNSRVRRTR